MTQIVESSFLPGVPARVPGQPFRDRAAVPSLPVAYDSGTPIGLGSVLATHVRHVAPGDSAASRSAWADAVLASLASDELALGSLTFSTGTDVMHRIENGGSRSAAHSAAHSEVTQSRTSSTVGDAVHAASPVPSEADYRAQVGRALDAIAASDVQKVVLGRGLDVHSTPPLDAHALLGRLRATRPGRHVFAVPTTGDLQAGPVLIGASPELLVRRTGDEVVSHPLAGSVPRSADPVEDAARAERLAHSAKDLAEHAFVVDAIVAALRPHCVEVHAEAQPSVMSTDTLWHLGTRIVARLAPGTGTEWSALHLAQLLHPTPAVGGVPEARAVMLIDAEEGDLRGPLAGAVGWVDAQGDGEFAVAIRAGVLHGARMRLFAGAGIVSGSVPELEARETGAKLLTMVRALGLPAEVVQDAAVVTTTASEGEQR